MTPYKNLSGKSNVVSYEMGEDSIHVVFKSGTHCNYLYDHVKPGRAIVDRMKDLAVQGHGLNSYITTTVRKGFMKKW